MDKKFDYTKAIQRLEQICSVVEDPSTSLDDIAGLVKESRELVVACREYLREVRENIETED